MKKIGILGGTFNPIHNAHIYVAKQVLEKVGLDKILFIPAGRPPWKSSSVLDANSRAKMVKIAIKDNPKFELSLIEVNRPGLSYTTDTLQELILNDPDAEFYYIMGADSFCNILKYNGAEEFIPKINFIVANREGTDPKAVQQIAEKVKAKGGKEVYILESYGQDISSTLIRDSRQLDKLVPKGVAQYIKNNGLYGYK